MARLSFENLRRSTIYPRPAKKLDIRVYAATFRTPFVNELSDRESAAKAKARYISTNIDARHTIAR